MLKLMNLINNKIAMKSFLSFKMYNLMDEN